MHNAFPNSESMTAFQFGQTREFVFSQDQRQKDAQPSCIVTIIEHWSEARRPLTRDTIIDLSLIDPESIKWSTDDVLDKNAGVLMMVATNDKATIVTKMEGDEKVKPSLSHDLFLDFLNVEYAQRFAKAFSNAVNLCGGKHSTF
jgi:hypothetical protein